ncbi:MAG TPA: Ig-like domain-containing protein [Polyangia bacterium]|nr:Ig-like domain-containing protein [Polyangia bacterium]
MALATGLLGISGCPTRDKYARLPIVVITSPTASPTYTHDTVSITAALDPALDVPVVLVDNGIELATLMPPHDTLAWNTAGVPEGTHTIIAEARFSSEIVRSAPISIVVDRTPPTVSRRTPSSGATNVELRAPIQAAFSEPVVLAQPADATFSLSVVGGSIVPTHAAFDAQAQTVTITIADPSAVPATTRLLVTIGGTITDRAGNQLKLPADDWVWEVPEYVKLPALPVCAGGPTVATRLPAFAIGAALDPVVLWASWSGYSPSGQAQCQLQVSEYVDGQWKQLSHPSDDPDSAHWGAALALDATDRPVVAWRPPSAPDPGEIDVASWSGTAWNALQPILPMPGVDFAAAYPVLRIGKDGNPILLWGAGLQADRYFIARMTPAGWNQNYGTIPIVSQQPFDGPHFDMVLDGSDNPVVAWVVPSGTGHASTWNGNAWSVPLDVSGMSNMTEPFLALDPTGAPLVAAGGFGTFTVQRLNGSSGWQLFAMTPPGAVPPQARHPRIAAGPDGTPLLGWVDAETTGVGVGRWNGQTWIDHEPSFGINANDEAPQVVVNRHGTAWVGWRDTTGQFNLWMLNN